MWHQKKKTEGILHLRSLHLQFLFILQSLAFMTRHQFFSRVSVTCEYGVHTSFYERSNTGLRNKAKKPVKRQTDRLNTVEYIAGKSFLFISFKKK